MGKFIMRQGLITMPTKRLSAAHAQFSHQGYHHPRIQSIDSQGGNSNSTMNSHASYGGERAMLVRSQQRSLPNQKEYSERALKYKQISVQHGSRNTSVLPRAASPETDKRSRSLPPDSDIERYAQWQGTMNGNLTKSMEYIPDEEADLYSTAYDPEHVHVVDRYIHNKSASEQLERNNRQDYYRLPAAPGGNHIPIQNHQAPPTQTQTLSRSINRVPSANYGPQQTMPSPDPNYFQAAWETNEGDFW